MKILFAVVLAIISYYMLKAKGMTRAAIVIGATLLISADVCFIKNPDLRPDRIFTILLFGAFLTRKDALSKIQSFPFLLPLFIVWSGFMATELVLQDSDMWSNMIAASIFLFFMYSPLFLGYEMCESNNALEQLAKSLIPIFFIMAIYGFYNAATVTNPITSQISKSFGVFDAMSYFFDIGRKRINSFMYMPMEYGFLLSFPLIGITWLYFGGLEIRRKFFVGLTFLFCLVNLFLTNSEARLFHLYAHIPCLL